MTQDRSPHQLTFAGVRSVGLYWDGNPYSFALYFGSEHRLFADAMLTFSADVSEGAPTARQMMTDLRDKLNEALGADGTPGPGTVRIENCTFSSGSSISTKHRDGPPIGWTGREPYE